jgi:hypothetical protein
MHVEPLEVYARDSNYAVVKPPGRRYPGSVIQGDTLSILCDAAKSIAEAVRTGQTETEDFLGDVEELTNDLIGRVLHYQRVLDDHGIELPYGKRFTEDDLVKLLPDED